MRCFLALWLLGRIACLVSALIPGWLAPVADLAFAVALEVVAARELFAAGNRRNYPLLAPVLVLATANLLMHLQALGVAIPIGLGWRLGVAAMIALIAVIGGQIVPAFTRNWLTAHGAVAICRRHAGRLDRIALGTLHRRNDRVDVPAGLAAGGRTAAGWRRYCNAAPPRTLVRRRNAARTAAG